MEIREINTENYLNTNEYDPSPNRFFANEKPVSERTVPIVYSCENCESSISFKIEDFEKHHNSEKTNLTAIDKKAFDEFIAMHKIIQPSFLDFYCPKCKQVTTFIFKGYYSGYWGYFKLKIENVLILKA